MDDVLISTWLGFIIQVVNGHFHIITLLLFIVKIFLHESNLSFDKNPIAFNSTTFPGRLLNQRRYGRFCVL